MEQTEEGMKLTSFDLYLQQLYGPPGNDTMLAALRRFVVRVAEDKSATPEQLEAMSRVAETVLAYS